METTSTSLDLARINGHMRFLAYFRGNGTLIFHHEVDKYGGGLSKHSHANDWKALKMFPDERYEGDRDPKCIMGAFKIYVYVPAGIDQEDWETNPVTAPYRLVKDMACEVQQFYAGPDMLRKITTFYTVVYHTKHPFPESLEPVSFSEDFILRVMNADFAKLAKLQSEESHDLSDALAVMRRAGIQPAEAPKGKPYTEGLAALGLGADYEAMEHIPEGSHNVFHQIAFLRNVFAFDDSEETAKAVMEQLSISIQLKGQRNPHYQGQGAGDSIRSIRAEDDPLRCVLPEYYAPFEGKDVEYEYPEIEFRCIVCEQSGPRPVLLFFSRKVDQTKTTPYSKVLEGKTNWEIICMMWRGEFMLCDAYLSCSEGLWRTPGLWVMRPEVGCGGWAKGPGYTYNTLAHPDLQREFSTWPQRFQDITKGSSKPRFWLNKYYFASSRGDYGKILSLPGTTTERILGAHINSDRTRLVQGPPAGTREAQIWKLCPRFVRKSAKESPIEVLRAAIADAKTCCEKAIGAGSHMEFDSGDEYDWCRRYVLLLQEYETKLAREDDETKFGAHAAGLTQLQAQWLLQWAVRKPEETKELDENVNVLGRQFALRQISVTVCGRDLILYTLQDKGILRRGVPLETLIGVVENSNPTSLGTFAKIFLGCSFLTQKPFEYTKQSPLDWMSSKTPDDVQKFKQHAFADQGFLDTQPEPKEQSQTYTYVAHMFDLITRWELAEKDKAEKEKKAETEHHIDMTPKVDSVFDDSVFDEVLLPRRRSASCPATAVARATVTFF